MEDPENRIQAGEVYVLMKKDYRISRNIRASWFFQHLNSTLEYTPQDHVVDTDDELQVVSVVADDLSPCACGTRYSVALTPSTMVMFVARRYRYVIILDLSPSVSSVDRNSCSVLYEQVHRALSNFLCGLVLPFCLPDSHAVHTPEIHITVIAYTPIKTFTFNQVLVQGLVIRCDNIDKMLAELGNKLQHFETTLANNFNKIVETSTTQFASSYFDVCPGRFETGGGSPALPKETDLINNPEAGIVNMIRYGMLALQLLPENSSAGLVVITDGCLGVPDANLFEFLLSQLRTSTIACTFLRIGGTRSPFGHYGHIPHTELMQFIATATFGSYFDSCPDVTKAASNQLNAYHRAMFLWSFQRGLEGFRYDLGDQHLMAQQSSPTQIVQRLLSHPIHGKLASVMPNIKKRQSESALNTSMFSVLSVRLREGYTIRDIALTKGESQIEVRMVLPWREYARFEYLIRASWPLDQHRKVTHSEITSEGTYDFLHDMTCPKINTKIMSPFRSANVRKFWLALQGLSQTDQLLVHLQTFPNNANHYTLPESIKEGVPLFYLPLTTTTVPALNTQLNAKEPCLNQLATFWRPVVNLDIKVWQKWMHTHRIGLVLEHDIPLHKNIHIASSSGRFSMVMCRQAMTSLNLFLKEWSTFVLLECQSYIKIMYENPEDKVPSSFLLIRITSKSPCLVLRLAFLGGTPGYWRHSIVKEIKQHVAQLRFPERGPKADKRRRAALKKSEEPVVVQKPPLLREWAEIYCCLLLRKPVESILIRYERMPRDMTKLEDQVKEMSHFVGSQIQAKSKSAVNLFNSLSRYLLHQRWIWTIQQPGVNSITMSGIGRILSTLTKMRLQEGFHFGLTNSGIVNLMLEVDMKVDEKSSENKEKSKQEPTCVIQYILFPPHVKTTPDSLSDDEGDEMEAPEDEGELQIITECWVEPQYGHAHNNTPERSQLDGLTCHQMHKTFYPLDLQCISSLITLEHLLYLCQNSVIPADLSKITNTNVHSGSTLTALSPTVHHIDFPFDLLSLLPRSQQAELLCPAYTCDKDADQPGDQRSARDSNCLLFSLLFEELSSSSHREVTLSEEQSSLFIKHLHARPRNSENNPYPFPISNFLNDGKSSDSETVEQTKGHPHGNVPDLSHSLSSSYGTTGFRSLQSGRGASTFSANAKNQGQNYSGVKNASSSVAYPKWKCFIKSANGNAVVLTFIPATFDDVMLLNKTVDSEEQGKDPKSCAKDAEAVSQAGKSVDSSQTTHSEGQATAQAIGDVPLENVGQSAEGIPECAEADQENTNDNAHAEKKAEKSKLYALTVPVYMYDCITRNVLDSLINPWHYQLPADIFQDLTFDFDFVQADSTEASPSSPKRDKRVSFSIDSVKDEEEGVRTSWRSHERRSTEGSNEGGENLYQHCYAVSEMFYNCYVKGVFQSLQKGFMIESQDVEAAINNICEESLPLESNMTAYLHSSCFHFQRLVLDVKRDQEDPLDRRRESLEGGGGSVLRDRSCSGERQQQVEGSKRQSVRFDIMDDADAESSSMHIPGVLELPHAPVTFDRVLNSQDACEPIRDVHKLVKDKFHDTVQKWFRAVPSNPDFYFYCPEIPVPEELTDERETTTSDAQGMNNEMDAPQAEININMDADNLSVPTAGDEKHSVMSMLDSAESLEDDTELELDLSDDNKASEQSPLFINFTCTVKSRLQQYSVSVRNITACLSELSSGLEHFSEVDLADLKITFDLNCLTLPGDLDSVTPRRPSYIRMLSNTSLGGQSASSNESLENGDRASSTALDLNHLKDPINHLPQMQHDAVTKCMEEIEWLLRDEIVSNLRHIPPIKCDTLNYVAKHVQVTSEVGKANVNVEHIPLQFVFGPDQSISMYIEEFQKMNLQNYQMIKEEEWYYLCKKRILAYTFVNAAALNCALTELSGDSRKLSLLSPREKAMKLEPEQSEIKHQKVLSPLVVNMKEKGIDIGRECAGRSSPLTIKSDSPSECVREPRRHSRDLSQGPERKPAMLSENLNLEGRSLLKRRKSKDLVLKMLPGSNENLCGLDKGRIVDGGEADKGRSSEDGSASSKELGEDRSGRKSTEPSNTSRTEHPTTSATKPDSPACTKPSTSNDNSPVAFVAKTGSPVSFMPQTGSPLSNVPKTGSCIPATQSPLLTAQQSICPAANIGNQASLVSTETSQITSAVQSPVTPDISIQLTKTDGRCEPFRASPEKDFEMDSFDLDDLEQQGVLKRCSSFAGFRTESTCDHLKHDGESISQSHSPVKGIQLHQPGLLGRSRHCSAPLSGQGTPRSRISTLPQTPSYISSRGSFAEDGTSYDGDMSEIDDSATTFSESGIIPRLLPNFWLILQINNATVDILYHHRETGRESNEDTLQQRSLLAQMRSNVESTCRKVNQQLLLENLNTTRMCHALLVDAADEDVTWKLDKGPRHRRKQDSSSENDDLEDDDTFESKYLAAAMDLKPGYFDCPCVWRTYFTIHPGLKRGAGGRGAKMSIGVKALRLVLDRFSVNNRQNMFVIKETTGNVCYLRLKEVQCGNWKCGLGSEDSGDRLSHSDGMRRIASDGLMTTDLDNVSLASSHSTLSLSQSQRTAQDCVELSVHGIQDAGKEVREHLVQMLQKKLDEKTLEQICEMLRRNPQCQLEKDDVQFIQKPGSEATTSLHLTICNKASPQLAAVMYYLRQNMLLFLHPPKYKTSQTENHFQDMFDGKLCSIPSDQAFLYIPPHTARKTGIACISVCLVDGQGNQVKLMQCPRPSSLAYMDIENNNDLESIIAVQTYEMKPQSKRPGPTALIQFHVWEQGDVDLPILLEKLTLTLKHALCDVLMEYTVLTAPICEIPKHVLAMAPPPPTMSAPSSPFHCTQAYGFTSYINATVYGGTEEFRERKLSMGVPRRQSDSGQTQLTRRPSLQTPPISKLQMIRDALHQSSRRLMSPTLDTAKTFDLPGLDSGPTGTPVASVTSSPQLEAANVLRRYECGDRGTLHWVYADIIGKWFQFCHSLDMPAVHKSSFKLKSRFSMDAVLQELHTLVVRLSAGTTSKVYKLLPTDVADSSGNVAVLYHAHRSPMEAGRRQSETSLDTRRPDVLTPGEDKMFIGVGRNLQQWHRFVQQGLEDVLDGGDIGHSTRGKTHGQKFEAHTPSAGEGKTFGMFYESASIIPRQTFLYFLLENKHLTLYTYNWTNEKFGSFTKMVGKTVQWNNARAHLLDNILTQKCGLFTYYLFGESISMEKMTQTDNLEQLIQHSAPPPLNREKLARTGSTSVIREMYLPFDAIFKDSFPKHPLHRSYLASICDPVKQYGKQAQDIRLDHRKEYEKVNSIYKLYVMWVQKNAPNYPIAEHIMKTLKEASRLLHHCATPLLFSTKWRQNVLEKYKVTRQDSVSSNMSSTATVETKSSRSRHGSGTSVGSARTKRTDSTEKKRPSLPNVKEVSPRGDDPGCGEEEWHLDLRSCFVSQYIKYLYTIGFNYVQMDRSHGKARRKHDPLSAEEQKLQTEEMEIKATDTHNLQKTVSGGVLLIELSFRREYFCVRLFACDHNKLGITVNQQLRLLFVDECEKCKDLIHVHSFAHDFHLRCIQSYISGATNVFKPSYYLSGLLTDFVQVYPYAPSFARNFMQRDVVSIPEPSCSSAELYEYMLNHARMHSMSVLKMVLPAQLDVDHHEHALISHETRQVSASDITTSKSAESYNVGLVILQQETCAQVPGVGPAGPGLTDTEKQSPALQLQFYIIMTSSEKIFPRHTLEKDLVMIRNIGPQDLKDQIKGQTASTNYLGYSNKHQPLMYQLLQEEALIVRSKIENMAVVSMDKCRRDCLWTKMLMNSAEDQSGDDRRKKRSDTEDSRDPLGRLTYEEFCEMLSRVHKVPLHEMDARLVPFLHMNHAWYQGLAQVLNNKFPDNVKRYFSNKNQTEQHHIILNPKVLDLFMLLSVDANGGKTGLYAVFRKPAKEQECICPGGQNLPEQSVQADMEQFINACCFHLWSTMLV